MELKPEIHEILNEMPLQFYDRIIQDISAPAWVAIFSANPIVKKEVLEGFSLQPGKVSRTLSLPLVAGRLRRRLQLDRSFLARVLTAWEAEQQAVISYLSMLHPEFILANLGKLRDLLGPERFCLGACSLGLLARPRMRDFLSRETFWTEEPEEGVFDLLVPVLSAGGAFIEKHPEMAEKFLTSDRGATFTFDLDSSGPERKPPADPELYDRFRKVEKKLERVQIELAGTKEQAAHFRSDNEALRKKLRELESNFDRMLGESLSRQRKEWFERYQFLDRESTSKESERLESVLQRTRKAFELQKRADEEYGLISDIRSKLLEIDLSLAKIESVYADSLVVHKEVEKAKEALINEKNRLLKLPGIRRILGGQNEPGHELISRINLLDPLPSNLPRINKLRKLVSSLADVGLIGDPAQFEEAVRHKKRQIMERLYSQFAPQREELGQRHVFRDLEDFIGSGESRRYTLYVDGYNVLLSVHGDEKQIPRRDFSQLREQFIEAAASRSAVFSRMVLIFDGIEGSRDLHGNLEIVYTDKKRRSADAYIIEKLSGKHDRKPVLVTADEGIISAVQERIFSLISPIDFYMFLFE
ncbi:MAG: NYN domain-containing protein [Desulfobacteraceae bacterium]|nr:NYN domain-containing protein [Desulfobacteraceae bacterium]